MENTETPVNALPSSAVPFLTVPVAGKDLCGRRGAQKKHRPVAHSARRVSPGSTSLVRYSMTVHSSQWWDSDLRYSS